MGNVKPMANKKKTATTETVTADPRHAGRIELLQSTVDDLCSRITDDPARSFRVRASRARSVSLKAKLAALEAIREAVNEAQKAIEAAATGTEEATRESRVALADL